jgi:hypothetical protein
MSTHDRKKQAKKRPCKVTTAENTQIFKEISK